MPLFQSIHPGFAVWKVTETFDGLRAQLPDEAEVPDYKSVSRRLEWAAVHVLLQYLLGHYTPVQHKASGAPFIPEVPYLSISHTKGYVAVCLSQTPVGIDVERLAERALKVRRRFMTEQEGFTEGEHQQTESTLIWSVKESIFKVMSEQEGVDFREHLITPPIPYQEQGRFSAYEKRTPNQERFEVHYQIYPDFVLTWATR